MKNLIFSILLIPLILAPQTNGGAGTSLPSTCITGSLFVNTTDSSINICTSTNNWTTITSGGGSSIPTGSILLIDSGSCPVGFAEVSGLSTKTLVGTVAANGDVGTTGGNDSITPTVNSLNAAAQIFTGNVLGTHAHELPVQNVSGTVHRVLAGSVFGTGTSRAAQGQITATANTTSAAVALSQAVTAGTPTGTNAASAVTGTLNSFDNRSAFMKVIFCKKS